MTCSTLSLHAREHPAPLQSCDNVFLAETRDELEAVAGAAPEDESHER